MKRNALTLVELLVVVAIIGILVTLSLPAVQMVRESARRAACQNNIKQIGVALQNYHSLHNRFPHGWQNESGWGWMAYTLPFVEQTPIYERINFEKRVTNSVHRDVILTRLEILMCPSSGDRKIGTFPLTGITPDGLTAAEDFVFPLEIARTQYVGSIGSSLATNAALEGG